MFKRIREEADRTASPDPWLSAAATLLEREVITEDSCVYLVELFVECLTPGAMENDPELLAVQEEMDAYLRSRGLSEDHDWFVDESPPEWRALNTRWERRDDQIKQDALRACGLAWIADIWERDPKEFSGRGAVGYYEVWGDEPW
ncbi:MAG: hypothetical protein K2X99_09140 [Gemmatimonadaceae bacterium]|nr:hypothetical protein [Gemmatimonadaceae bacterium]